MRCCFSIPQSLVSFLLSGVLLLAGVPVLAQAIVVAPDPLEVMGDSVVLHAALHVPADKAFRKEGTYVVLPSLGSYRFTPVRIPSSSLESIDKKGIKVKIRSSALFEEGMLGATLQIRHEYWYGKQKKVLPALDSLASCCITTGRLFLFNNMYSMMHYTYEPEDEAPLTSVLQFTLPNQDSTRLQYSAPADLLQQIKNYLQRYPNTTITLRTTASPTGNDSENKKLALKRARNAQKWLMRQLLDSADTITSVPAEMKLEATTQDWMGFKQRLLASSLSAEVQKQIAEAISSGRPALETEEEIICLVGDSVQAVPFLQPLLQVSIILSSPAAKRPGYTLPQIDSLMQQYSKGFLPASALANVFSGPEFLMASLRTRSKDDRLRLLSAYLTQKFADYRIYSDIAVITEMSNNKVELIEGENSLLGLGFQRTEGKKNKGVILNRTRWKFYTEPKPEPSSKSKQRLKIDYRDSESLLLQAYAISYNNPVVNNNLGAYYIGQGRFSDAFPYLELSLHMENTIAAHYNMGLYYSRMGNYQKAVKHFNQASYVKGVKYNRAIARLMSGDLIGAETDIEAFIQENPRHVLGHYVGAIVAARQHKLGPLLYNLRQAIEFSMNNSVRNAAKEDLEFRFFWQNERFAALVAEE